jgi:hypothetical protein
MSARGKLKDFHDIRRKLTTNWELVLVIRYLITPLIERSHIDTHLPLQSNTVPLRLPVPLPCTMPPATLPLSIMDKWALNLNLHPLPSLTSTRDCSP